MASRSKEDVSREPQNTGVQDSDGPMTLAGNETDETDGVIKTEPEGVPPIGESNRPSMQTVSETWSGYHRETNECTEFCQDCLICFGACDACCPSTGEGCLSSTAAFFGNIMVGFCKC